MTTAAAQDEVKLMPWWLVLIEGIALIVLGLLFLAKPGMTTLVLVQFLGIYWLVAGMFRIISIFLDRAMWGWKLFAGILGIIAGLIVVRNPLWSTVILGNTLIVLVGIMSIVMGAISLWRAFKGAGWGEGILGAVSILLGVLLLANVWLFTFSLPWTLGLLSIVGGILAIWGAFQVKKLEEELDKQAAAAAAGPGAAVRAVAYEVVEKAPAVETAAPAEEVAAAAISVDELAEAAAEGGADAKIKAWLGLSVDADLKEALRGSAFQTGLEYIEGVGPVYAGKLEAIGINSPLDLLVKGATRKGREEIAEQADISSKLVLEWVNHVDLYRIKGVGSEYADLLEEAGVDTVVELAQRNAVNLYNKLVAVNAERKLVRQLPGQSQVTQWVGQAKELPRVIAYD
jgi:uncharacterized membrane protein HdeD (DUF308 family)/predicted flap endonuclease-1-like 5' DNA nuclease